MAADKRAGSIIEAVRRSQSVFGVVDKKPEAIQSITISYSEPIVRAFIA